MRRFAWGFHIAGVVLAVIVLVALLHGCRAVVNAAGTGAPLPGVAIVRLSTCKSAPAKSAVMFDDWARVETDVATAQAACGEVWPDYQAVAFDLDTTPNDPNINQQYSLARMHVLDAWSRARGDGVVIAILDTGMDFAHPDLAGKAVNRGRDFINGDSDATDDQGHGTHVSGIAAAATNNNVGVAGVGWNARILPGKVLGANGSGSMGTLAEGINWASQQPGVKVINMSLGCECPALPYIDQAVANARGRGVVVIAAAGNARTDSPHYPASAPGVIGVGASTYDDQRADFSNYGVNARVAAPGRDILSTTRGGGYASWNGTSMAAPNAAGVAALIWSVCPGCTVDEVERRLVDGDDIGSQGMGKRVNAAKAVGENPSPSPSPTRGGGLPTPGAGGCTGQSQECELFGLINAYRRANGLTGLVWSPALTDASRTHNRWMREHGCFAHVCPGEAGVEQRMTAAGFVLTGWGGENIGAGYQSAQAMFEGWRGSSGHNAFMLSGLISHAGIGYLQGADGWSKWWTFDGAKGYDLLAPMTATPMPWPPPATPRPLPTATTVNGLPRGWFMVIEVPYDTSTRAQIDQLYRELCVARARDGVRCDWNQYRVLEAETP